MSNLDKKLRFTLERSSNGMMCISIKNPTCDERSFWHRALRANHRDDQFYIQRQKVHPFLQCDRQDYVLIEFWTSDEQAVNDYIAWCSSVFDSEAALNEQRPSRSLRPLVQAARRGLRSYRS